jgi:hypothetical protein
MSLLKELLQLNEANSFDDKTLPLRTPVAQIGNAKARAVSLVTAQRGTAMVEVQLQVAANGQTYNVYGDFYNNPVKVIPEMDMGAVNSGDFTVEDANGEVDAEEVYNLVTQVAKNFLGGDFQQYASNAMYDNIDDSASAFDDEAMFSKKLNPRGFRGED